jgi:hypothetical protein
MDKFSLKHVFDACSSSFLKGWKYLQSLPIAFMILNQVDYSWILLFWIKGFVFAYIILKIISLERIIFEERIANFIPYPKKTLNFISISPLILIIFLIGFIK